MKTNKFLFLSISVIWFWLIIFALIPFLFIIVISFLTKGQVQLISFKFTLANYEQLLQPLYLKIFEKSFLLAAIVTLITLIIAYPFAYTIARSYIKLKHLLLLLVIVPFWTSSIIRSYAMIAILKAKGLVNSLLLTLGIIHVPLQILYTNIAVIIGLVYNLLPFMILPLYANMERLDNTLIEAAKDLGANQLTIFRRVIVPLTTPGILAGCIIVFLPAMTLFYIPDILGGAKSTLLGNVIEQEFLFTDNWPFGAAISVILTFIMVLLLFIYWHNSKLKDRQTMV